VPRERQRNDRLGRRNSAHEQLEQWREILRAIRSDAEPDFHSHTYTYSDADA
jgi:hypothetical protein